MQRRWLAIVNPACSGMRQRAFREKWLRRLRYGATKVVICEKPGDAAHIISELHDFDGIAAVGGDGTVFDMLPALDPALHCLTVFPAGRGNSLARALGFASMEQSLIGLRQGVERPTDLLLLHATHADGRTSRAVCASTIAVGYVAAVAARAQGKTGRHSYSLAAMTTKPELSRMQISYDGKPPQARTLTGLVISNIDYAAQFRAFPDAQLDDGYLHAMELDAPRLRQLGYNLAMLAGLRPRKSSTKARSLRARSGKAFDLLADGEILTGVTEFSVDCVSGAILCNRAVAD
jgi:diacylglycerol kinase (ATP)